MKKTILTMVGVLMSILALAQAVSLRAYCPDQQGQDGATCASYAPVYTALSTQYNALHHYRSGDPQFTVFSYGFVASKIKAGKNLLVRLFTRCGWNVQADLALDVLKETGTVFQDQFPYTCSCSKQQKVQAVTPTFKIKDYQLLGDTTTAPERHLAAIKDALNHQCPVIISLLQTDFFHKNQATDVVFPSNYQREEADANHVICIVGYDDNRRGGSFLVKNNYVDWAGDQGYAYVRYDDLFKLIRYSYRMAI